jgi:phenylpropionate dioxygenase-like ring-hydroxylating dioxygenase large terminal subunit
MFLQQIWYAAWWADELSADKLYARTIADEAILFWRDDNGEPRAILDRCPHRYAPLSRGKRVPGGIQCGYHGIAFDGAGRCIANPHGAIVSALCVRAFPVAERHKLIWIWMGTADHADPARIPDLRFADRAPSTAYSRGFLPTAAGHQLITDNILDLTHADYLHATTLGGGSVTRSKARIEEREDSTVFIEWLANNEVALPFFQSEMSDPNALTDMWTSVLWHPNGVMTLRFGATPAGRPRTEGIDTWSAHLVTPESARTTHYFYFNTREFRVDDVTYNERFAAGLRHAFTIEDKPMIEAQQRNLGDADLFDRKPVLLPTDSASTRARRVYSRILDAERAASTAVQG